MNLIKLQKEYFYKILNAPILDQNLEVDEVKQKNYNGWKILIYDDHTQNILTNFKTGDLREHNVTLHLHVKQKKEKLIGVNTIYFIHSSSIQYFYDDLKNNYFDQIYLNFCDILTKNFLEELSQNIIKIGQTHSIQRILQFNMDYCIMGKQIFNMTLNNNYKENELAQNILSIVQAQKCLPIILSEKDNSMLDNVVDLIKKDFLEESQLYVDHLLQTNSQVLLILNDNIDQSLQNLVHSFKYFPLIVENFQICQNLINFSNFSVDDLNITLDFVNDKFLIENSFIDYPEVNQNIFKELEQWKKEHDKYTNQDQMNNNDNFHSNFLEAIENLPRINEQKKTNKNHLKISGALMKEVEKRSLEKFCVLSSDIIKQKKLSNDQKVETNNLFLNKDLLKNDKLRLFLIILKNTDIQKNIAKELKDILFNNTVLNAKEKNLIENLLNEKYQNQVKTNDSLFNSMKQKSKTFLTSIIKKKYTYKGAQEISQLLKEGNSDNYRLTHLEKSELALNLQQVKRIIFITINGGNLEECDELINLGKEMNIEVICGMDYLKHPDIILNNLINN